MPKRGKLKEQKYKEAVARNLAGMKVRKEKYRGLKLETAKRLVGVRDIDDSYDSEIEKNILPEKKKKKENNEKTDNAMDNIS